MATRATEAPGKATPTRDEPFYGWRYLRQKAANGRYEYVQVPLTYDDLLNPQEGDHVIHSSKHQRRLRAICNAIEVQLRDDPTAVVLDDVLIDWGIPGLRNHGPDIAVYFGIREEKNWTIFHVAEEGVRPTLLVEIVSPDTARHDRRTKVEEYHRAGVPYYILVDYLREHRQERLRLVGYRWTAAAYAPLEPDADGRLWLPPVRLWLGIADNEIVCHDAGGNEVGNVTGQAEQVAAARRQAAEAERQAIAAERQAIAEARARADAEERLRQLEAELRRLRGEE